MLTVAQTYFISVIKSAVNQGFLLGDCPFATEGEWNQLNQLVKRNKLDSLFYERLKSESAVPSWLLDDWKERCCAEIMLDVRQRYEIERIAEHFRAANVPFAFVKGSLLKTAYPHTYERYMSDIDVFILPQDRARVRACMESIGATVSGYDGNDENFEMPDGVCVETHGYMFFRRIKSGVTMYSDERYFDIENNRLTDEGYALHLLMHMISNLCQMGLGIRYVLDLWIYRHRYDAQPDWNVVFEELRNAKLDTVAHNLIRLSEHWFGDDPQEDLPSGMEEYILSSSLYGVTGQVALNNASIAGCKTRAVLHHVFLTKEEYKKRYPWLVRYPWLLPAAWFARAFKTLRHHGHNTLSWMKRLITAQNDEVERRRDMLKRIGF